MKKVTILVLSFTIFALSLAACSKKEETTTTPAATVAEERTTSTSDNAQSAETVSENDGAEQTITSGTEGYPEDGGGNPDISNATVLSITVSEDRYFVDNHEIDFDDLVEKIKTLAEGSYVKLFDEKSTLKAFNRIKEYLEENNIPYEVE